MDVCLHLLYERQIRVLRGDLRHYSEKTGIQEVCLYRGGDQGRNIFDIPEKDQFSICLS